MAYDGQGRSGNALERYREIYRDALRDCLSKLLASFEQTLKAHDVRLKRSELSQPMVDMVYTCLQPIVFEFKQRLAQAANNAGLPLHNNLDDEVARIQAEVRVEVDLLLGRLQLEAAVRQKRWYERPLGLVLIGILVAVVGGLLVTFLTRLVRVREAVLPPNITLQTDRLTATAELDVSCLHCAFGTGRHWNR